MLDILLFALIPFIAGGVVVLGLYLFNRKDKEHKDSDNNNSGDGGCLGGDE